MKTVVMRLEGPLQSWGVESKGAARGTLAFPSRSGVMGMILAAIGLGGGQEEMLERLSHGRMDVISWHRPGRQMKEMTDFQTVGTCYDGKDPWQSLMIPRKRDGKASSTAAKIIRRHILQDAAFTVLLEVDDGIADDVATALSCPAWPLFLGRAAYIPSKFIYAGTSDSITDAEVLAEKVMKGYDNDTIVREEDGCTPGAIVLTDVPLSFGKTRRYCTRYVTISRS